MKRGLFIFIYFYNTHPCGPYALLYVTRNTFHTSLVTETRALRHRQRTCIAHDNNITPATVGTTVCACYDVPNHNTTCFSYDNLLSFRDRRRARTTDDSRFRPDRFAHRYHPFPVRAQRHRKIQRRGGVSCRLGYSRDRRAGPIPVRGGTLVTTRAVKRD